MIAKDHSGNLRDQGAEAIVDTNTQGGAYLPIMITATLEAGIDAIVNVPHTALNLRGPVLAVKLVVLAQMLKMVMLAIINIK